jgi:hypothetical protein
MTKIMEKEKDKKIPEKEFTSDFLNELKKKKIFRKRIFKKYERVSYKALFSNFSKRRRFRAR